MFVSTIGVLQFGDTLRVYGIRPSISLRNDLIVSRGDGTSTNPYELVLE